LKDKKHILKKQNPNFVLGKKKKTWFVKFLALKNHFLEMNVKVSFSKCAFNKNMVKKWVAKLTLKNQTAKACEANSF
jgi:hypothetical protein